jgi:hypothetical protein
MSDESIPRALIERLLSEHACAPGATAAEIDAAESRLGLQLPEQLLDLLRAANGVDLWRGCDFPFRLLSTAELERPQHFVYHAGPDGLLAVGTSRGDAQCLAVQTERFSSLCGKVVDCYHETFPFEILGVCDSVAEMLRLALDSEGREWIWPAARKYGVDYAR